MTATASDLFCAGCGKFIASRDAEPDTISAAQRNHGRFCITDTTGRTPMTTPLRAVPATETPGKRPHPKTLVDHPDARIRRAARRVMDAVDALDQAWEANSAKAELRAQRDRLKAQLAEVEAQIKGGPGAAKRDTKAIRSWAAANGIEVSPAGIVPRRVVEAFEAAHQ